MPVLSQQLSFAFSGCGWLTPYHLGVISGLKECGLLHRRSIVAGSSGGAIAATLTASGISEKDVHLMLIDASKSREFKGDIDKGLKRLMKEIIPDDAYLRCTDIVHITLTKVKPTFNGRELVISKFGSNEELINVVAASCFIPLWSSRRLYTKITDGPTTERYLDGGILAFTPRIGEVTVTPLPRIHILMHPQRKPASISPSLLPSFKYSTMRLTAWGLFPPSEDKLDMLFRVGKESAEIWIRQKESLI